MDVPHKSAKSEIDDWDGILNGNCRNQDLSPKTPTLAGKCPNIDDGSWPPPIAITGMAMRLPGGVNSAASFWDLILKKGNGRCRVPGDRYNIDAFYDARARPGTVKTEYAHFIDNYDLRHFDSSFFSMSKSEVEKVDPQQRMLLEVVRECLENAGKTSWRGDTIGCYVGSFGEDWLDLGAKDTQSTGMYRITGSGDFVLGNRVSYEFDFKGPSMTIKTGCSSSMIGLHMACQALYNGDCSSAVVGGTNMMISPTMSIAMTEQGVLSSTGSCKTFDASADGYSRGEAINAIYLKTVSDAIRDGDTIRGVIRSTSTNCDGKTPGIASPSAESHETLIRRAYEVAKIDHLSETGFVECHGTGTAIGDPLEVQAIARVFGDNDVYIGSVKPNVGHSEGASGITSIIKMVLALEKKIIPPNTNFLTLNPKLSILSTRLQVPVEALPWPERRERVSVNSFGIGGANAHVIIDSASSFGVCKENRRSSSRLQLLVFSANHQTSVLRGIENYQEYVASNRPVLEDLAYTLGARREHLSYRVFCVASGHTKLGFSSPRKASFPARMTFVFTGQGAQWIGMAKELIEDYSSFRKDIKDMDDSLALLPQRPLWKLESELLESQTTETFNAAEFSQPLCTAVQIAVVNLLRSWSISPLAVVGHSSGEIAAAFTSGALTAAEAITIAYYRGQVMKQNTQPGAMVSVGLSKLEIDPYLMKGLSIACENSPNNVTLSGDPQPMDDVIQRLRQERPEVFVRPVSVKVAYHSYHMQKLDGLYHSMIERHVTARKPIIPFYSSVTGRLHASDVLDVSYWAKNLVSPVLFSSAIQAVLAAQLQVDLLLEIGSHSALAAPLRQILKSSGSQASYLPTMVRGRDCSESLLSAVGELYVRSVPIDFLAMSPNRVVLTDLPAYPWNHESEYWSESRVSRDWRLRKFPKHELLGSRVLECTDLEPSWRNLLNPNDVHWIRDHKLHEDVVFPIAGYVAMVGEGIRQIAGAAEYTLKDIVVGKAMVFHDSNAIEIVTNFRPVRLTSTLESEWYDFSVSSYNGSEWTKHCVGKAKSALQSSSPIQRIEHLPRSVPSSIWYEVMKKAGLNYGCAFQRLKGISASTSERIAVATVTDFSDLFYNSYSLHPATIDSCLQLFSVAMTRGVPRLLNRLYVPTSIGEIYISKAYPEILGKATISSRQRNSVGGDVTAIAQGATVMSIKNLGLSCLEDNDTHIDTQPHAVARLVWKPDIDFMDPRLLIQPVQRETAEILLVERLSLLCMVEASNSFASAEVVPNHIRKYISWIHLQKSRAERGDYELVQSAEEYVRFDSTTRLSLIESIGKEIASTKAAGLGSCIIRVFGCFSDIYRGHIDPVEALVHDGALAGLYDYFAFDCKAFLGLLGHKKPSLRVLEIGAGTGGTTSVILDGLTSEFGERMYFEYHYTDVSAGFFVNAKNRFKDAHNIKYDVLDISKDPLAQGYEEGYFDLIIAANVLHATPCIGATLLNVRKVIHPSGTLLLQELCPVARCFNYVFGLFPGWWLGETDGRSTEPYISPEKWDEELKNAGFNGTDAVIYDDELPYQINANILASPRVPAQQRKSVTLLCGASITPLMLEVENAFVRQGYNVDFCTLSKIPSASQDIIALLDLEGPFFGRIDASVFESFKSFIGSLKSTGILWVTKSTHSGEEDPLYALVLGMARTLRKELSVDFGTFETDDTGLGAWDALGAVFEKFQRRKKDSDLDPEYEYAWIGGVTNIGRFHWSTSVEHSVKAGETECAKRLQIGKHGLMKTLYWEEYQPDTLIDSEVEIDTRAVGMNFKDILISMGLVNADLIEGNIEGSGLGCEASGIITRVGPEVQDFEPGDRVLTIASGAFSTVLTTSASLCARMADDMSFEDAATMPCVYSTVIYSLLEIGRLDADQIFATVGNQEKRQYLSDTFDIPSDRIFNSRDTSFLQDVMRATVGKGVDIVLNSLSGELLHASWQCVAPFGTMIEIGKRDLIGHAQLRMDPFEANRSFVGVDLAQLSKERPAKCRNLLAKCMEMFQSGLIKPIKPTILFEAAHIEAAFRYMQKGQHIGKIVVRMPAHSQELHSTIPNVQNLVLRPDVSYLLIGGLGGLGKSVSSWMVENGARHLLYLSRSAGKSKKDQAFLQELESQNCATQVLAGDVSSLQDVKDLVGKAIRPIAGVLQMSMILKDSSIGQMTYENWQTVLSPKVQGTWNLHEALKAEKLDFFVMFSSVSGIVGQSGQANYAAANTFLDAFMQYRHRLHLPASVLDIGVVEDVGYVSQNPAVLKQMRAINAQTISEQALLDALQISILQNDPRRPSSNGIANQNQLVVGLGSRTSILDPQSRCPWRRDVRMSMYRNSDHSNSLGSPTAGNESLKSFLTAVAANPSLLADTSSLDFLSREIGACLCSFVQIPVEDLSLTRSLVAMGIDSLLAIEVRNWWRQALGLEVTTLEILGSENVAALGRIALEGLKLKHSVEAKQDEERTDTYLLMKAP